MASIRIGDNFGRWVVIGPEDPTKRMSKTKWIVECTCPEKTRKTLRYDVLTRGESVSCGCFKSEQAREHIANVRPKTSGLAGNHPIEFNAWKNLKQKILNPNNPSYEEYGGAGKVMAQEWLDSFETFFSDMGPRPEGRTSIALIDKTKPFGKGNAVWSHRAVSKT